jgi:hypothetical protein
MLIRITPPRADHAEFLEARSNALLKRVHNFTADVLKTA